MWKSRKVLLGSLLLLTTVVTVGLSGITTSNISRFISITANLLLWETDTDFNKGSLTNVVIDNINDSAAILLDSFNDETNNIDYETPGQYVASSTNIIVSAGAVTLAGLTGGTTTYPFTSPGDYTLTHSTEITVTGGKAQLKQVPLSRVGHWHLNEVTGSTATDSSSNGNNGTLVNMENADWVSAKLNNGLIFDGVDEYINLGNIANFERTDKFSIEFWFKTTTSATKVITSRMVNSGSTFRGWHVFIRTGKITTALINNSFSSLKIEKETNSTFNDGVFHHVIVTYDGSSSASGVAIYVDGTNQATTTLFDALSDTMQNSVNCQISGRDGANLVFPGTIDEVIIYNVQLTSTNVTTRYNSGTGTEDPVGDGTFFKTNPTVSNVTGFDFTAPITSFLATEILSAGTSIQYTISGDTGTTFNYFNGSIWTPSNDTFDQSNTSSTVNDNISTFNSSGTFIFKAFLSSTGTFTPQLDSIVIGSNVEYSTDDNLYVDTTDLSQVVLSTPVGWKTLTISRSIPSVTTGTILFSIDDRSNWQTFNGTEWTVVTDSVTRSIGTGFGDAETNIISLSTGLGTLDARVFLKTDNSTVTLNVSNILIISSAGKSLSGNFISNQYDSGNLDQIWGEFQVSSFVPTGSSLSYSARSANTTSELSSATYTTIDFTDNGQYQGEFIQLKIDFVGTASTGPSVNNIGVEYITPGKPQRIAP